MEKTIKDYDLNNLNKYSNKTLLYIAKQLNIKLKTKSYVKNEDLIKLIEDNRKTLHFSSILESNSGSMQIDYDDQDIDYEDHDDGDDCPIIELPEDLLSKLQCTINDNSIFIECNNNNLSLLLEYFKNDNKDPAAIFYINSNLHDNNKVALANLFVGFMRSQNTRDDLRLIEPINEYVLETLRRKNFVVFETYSTMLKVAKFITRAFINRSMNRSILVREIHENNIIAGTIELASRPRKFIFPVIIE